LCRMVSGQGSWGRPLNRVKLIETLQTRMKRALQNECVDDDATASDAEPSASIDDPMLNLAFGAASTIDNVKEEQKKKTKRVNKKNVLLRLKMPREAPEKNPACAETYEVRVWLANQMAVWIHVEDLPWAVAFMHDQYTMGGVSAVVDEPEQLPSPSPVKSKNVRWDFNSDCWVATVETGSSVKERRLKPSQITSQEASMLLDQNVSLKSMGYEEQKRIAHEILTAWLEQQDSVQNSD